MTEKHEKDLETGKKVKKETEDKKSKEVKELKEELEKTKEELEKAKNDYYKAYADADNFKKRIQAEQEVTIKYRAQGIALDLLPSLDNLERALANSNQEDPFVKGVVMVYDQLVNALKKEGVEEIEALDKVFDHNLHHALMCEKVEGVEAGQIIEVLQKGYKLKDRVLRASLVKVSE